MAFTILKILKACSMAFAGFLVSLVAVLALAIILSFLDRRNDD